MYVDIYTFSPDSNECLECRATFQWYDGADLSFENWHDYNPDSDDSCVMVHEAKWMDADCDWPRGFVCKRPGKLCVKYIQFENVYVWRLNFLVVLFCLFVLI